MQIILHIGMHKTGSTSIQRAMKRYDDGKTMYARLGVPNHSMAFQAAFNPNYQDYHLFRREGYSEEQRTRIHKESLAAINKVLQQTKRQRLIFSGEDITGLTPVALNNMQEMLGRYSSDIRTIAYVRHPIGHALSNVQEVLKNGGTELTRAMQPRYRSRLKKFADRLGEDKTSIHLFDRNQLVAGNVVDDFAARLELDRGRMGHSDANRRVSFEVQKCLFVLNRSQMPTVGDPVLNAARMRFIRLLNRLLPETPEPDGTVFVPHFDKGDIAWMSKQLDECFDLPKGEPPSTPLPKVYSDIGDATIDVLLTILRAHGISNTYLRNPVKLLCRIFSLCLSARPALSANPYSPYYFWGDPTIAGAAEKFSGQRSRS